MKSYLRYLPRLATSSTSTRAPQLAPTATGAGIRSAVALDAAGVAVFFWRRSTLATIVVGMAVYLPLHLGLGW